MSTTRNSNDLSRFMGNKAMENRTVGNTYGDRLKRKHELENQKVQTIQRPPRQQPVDNFARKSNACPNPNFANPKDKYTKSHKPKGMVAHKTLGTELLERGHTGVRPSDAATLGFLDEIRRNPTLWSSRDVSKHYGPKPKRKPGTPAARQAVDGMARAKAQARKPVTDKRRS